MRDDSLERRLAGFFETAPRPAAPASLRTLATRVETLPAVAPRRRVLPALAAVAAALVLVAGGAGVALVMRQTRSEVNVPAATRQPDAMPGGGPAGYAAGDYAWVEVGADQFRGVSGLRLFDVAGGILAVGASGSGQPQLWRSTDGFDWRALDASPFANLAYTTVVSAVAHGPAGYLAVGGRQPNRGPAGALRPDPSVWRSDDGVTWTGVATTGLPAGWLSSVAATSFGYVASVQYADHGVVPAPAGTEPVAFSRDGVHWEVSHQVDAGTVLAAFDRFFFVRESASGSDWAAVSDDGVSWSRLDFSRYPGTIVSSPPTLTAFARQNDLPDAQGDTTVWRTSDGRTWRAVGRHPTGTGFVNETFAYDRWFALDTSSGSLMTSEDGVAWARHGAPFPFATTGWGAGSLQSAGAMLFDVTFARPGEQPGPYGVVPAQVHLFVIRPGRAGDVAAPSAPPTSPPQTPPPGGIGMDRAIAAALAAFPEHAGPAAEATSGQYREFVGGASIEPDRWVWQVVTYRLHAGCTAWGPPEISPGAPCWKGLDVVRVYVDYLSGAVLAVVG